MKRTWIIAVVTCMIISKITCKQISDLTFPEGFKFGTATSAFQIEGAWNVSDKGESVWDAWTHSHSESIADGSNADVACDSYHKYKEDVQLIKDIGLDHYRFSISWSRILPSGLPSTKISRVGLQYYKNLIDECLAKRIEPIVTIYHFDHPQILENMGGWTNDSMVEWYAEYARIVFKELGPKVKIFVTINQPQEICERYKNPDTKNRGKDILDVGVYKCLHNTIKAHATAYHIYDKEFRKFQGGEIGFANPCRGYLTNALDNSSTNAAEIAFQFYCGILSHPIYKGDWPNVVKNRLADLSEKQGHSKSLLPEFTPEWKEYIKGTADYFGLNHYTSKIYSLKPEYIASDNWDSEVGVAAIEDNNWTNGSSSWLKVVPEGFSKILLKIKEEYGNPLVYVMENGYSDYGELEDYDRINYHYLYLKELLKAINVYGCNVSRYTIWSLLDNFEFIAGYTSPFGITKVEFNDENRTRTRKLSSVWWKEITRTRQIQAIPTA